MIFSVVSSKRKKKKQFTEEIPKAKNQMQRWSKSSVIKEMQMRAKMIHNIMIVILAKIRKTE